MATTPEIEQALEGFEIDLSAWRMADKNAFARATSETDESPAFPMAAQVVKKWPFEGDPSDPESYGRLDFDQWPRVYRAIIGAVSLRFRNSK